MGNVSRSFFHVINSGITLQQLINTNRFVVTSICRWADHIDSEASSVTNLVEEPKQIPDHLSPKMETLLRAIHLDVLYFQFLSIKIFREADIFRHDMLLCRHLLTDSHGYRFVLAGVLAEAAYFAEKLRVLTFRDSAYYWRRGPATRINCRKMRNERLNNDKRMLCFKKKPLYLHKC